ncbi:hypothetical protein KSP40_PGU010983 [Platanthera guangdongensis]|uniref:Uncharacterized protein n=1 Tax=Platanthera guangdongensis TaxID=2320717 RepID=A0ABR2M2I2_9ASPA
MDPNPKRFPILSYVMSRLQSAAHKSATEDDIEAANPASASPVEMELVERMPHLVHRDLLASMSTAISDVAQNRSVLQSLGERPDHEALDAARSHIAEIDATLTRQLDDIDGAPRSSYAEREQCRAKADADKLPYNTVLKLNEMHEAYESLLKEAEERLEMIYSSTSSGYDLAKQEEKEDDGDQLNEEVIAILQEASVNCVERVKISGQQLRFLPEAFGRIRGLVSLDISNNQLEAIPDAIAGLELLQELQLSSNLLVSLPDSIGLLLNMKILDVSNNKLKALPDSISHCSSLLELNASYNELTYLPTNIGYELVNLQKLWIYLNKLRSLPASICEMRSLRLLDAHFNELRGLPYAIGKLTNLEYLNLSSNFSDLKVLPPTFGDLINLVELDFSNNQIHALPDSFGRLDSLSKLNLDQNPLVIPPIEVVNQGVEAVKLYMSKRWMDILLLEEKENNQVMENPESITGWLTRSTSWLNNFVAGVSVSVAEYLGGGEKSYRDPCLDQQL